MLSVHNIHYKYPLISSNKSNHRLKNNVSTNIIIHWRKMKMRKITIAWLIYLRFMVYVASSQFLLYLYKSCTPALADSPFNFLIESNDMRRMGVDQLELRPLVPLHEFRALSLWSLRVTPTSGVFKYQTE